MTRPDLTAWALALTFPLAASCGGGAPPEEPLAEAPPDESSGAEEPEGWASLGRDELVARVREDARARIAEVAPELDLSGLDGWLLEPEQAPELGDRVSEQLVNLAVAAAAAGESDRAVRLVRLVRARARNRNRAYTGTTLLAELARRGPEEPAGQQAAIRAVLGELPPNRFGSATVVYRLFQNEEQLDARLARLHAQVLGLDTAVSALFYDAILRSIVQHRDEFLSVIDAIAAERADQPAREPYAFSTVDLTGDRRANPVVVGVWDTGVAADVLPTGQLFTNEAETPNGEDDDGNGLVDDIHGVIADPTPGQDGLIFEPGDDVVAEYAPFLKGIMDLRAGLASTEAAERVIALMGETTDPEAVERLESNLDAVGEWAHGTHVAGILTAGLPQARVAVFRSAWAGERRLYHHRGPTDAELAAERANVEDIARFINAHGVRVVNASLGFTQDYLEAELGHEADRYPTIEAIRARAEEVHAQRAANWRYVFETCPDTLFVVSAGNSNRDVVEYGDVPSSFELPNLLIVGAVDRFGDWATFTNSNPDRVVVFDHGVEVDSVIPNGEQVPLSGTSMASPNAANLAAKLISVEPSLTPARAIRIIEETAAPIEAPFYGQVPDERQALAEVGWRPPRRRR